MAHKHLIFNSFLRVASVVAALVMMPTATYAQLSASSDEPVEISGDQFEAFQDKNYVIWTGDVQVVQGAAILTAPRLTIYGVDDGSMDRIDAVGGIRYTSGEEAISSDTAVYKAADETVTFTGNVVVVQGEQVLSGGQLVYYTQTGQIVFTAQQNGRVRGIFISDPDDEKKS